MTDAVLTEIKNGVATLTLNRPAKLNAWDTPMRAEVSTHLEAWNKDPKVRAVILTGAGDRAFSAGQDLDETQKIKGGTDGLEWFKTWRRFYDSLRKLEKPCVAALNGVAAGSAFQFVLQTDVRVGHPGSRMGQPEINSGIPSVLGPMLMNERLGISRTTELTLTGRMMDGAEAHAIGLLHYLVPRPEEVMPKALELAEQLASKPQVAMRLTKRRLNEMSKAAYEDALAAGGPIQAEGFATGEPQATMRLFFEERARRRAAKGRG